MLILANILGLGNPEMLLIFLAVLLLLFGGKKIPELMRGMGRGVGELKKGLEEGKQSFREAVNTEESGAPSSTSAAPSVTTPAESQPRS